MRQQQLEGYLTHIEGIVDAAIANPNKAVAAIVQIKGVLNLSKRKSLYEFATERQQQASIKRDEANNHSGY